MYKKKSTQAAGLEPNAPKQLQCLNNNSEISGATLTVVSQIQKVHSECQSVRSVTVCIMQLKAQYP